MAFMVSVLPQKMDAYSVLSLMARFAPAIDRFVADNARPAPRRLRMMAFRAGDFLVRAGERERTVLLVIEPEFFPSAGVMAPAAVGRSVDRELGAMGILMARLAVPRH